MPLTDPPPRRRMHARDITVRGYTRDDGLFDIEGHLTDTKAYGFDSDDRGRIEAGEPIHDMWMRLTIDEDMVIVDCEAVTDSGPFHVCPAAAPKFAALAGLSIKAGFLRAAAERIGGVKGCTHLREMLQQMGTVAYQTLYQVRMARAKQQPVEGPAPRPAMIDSCFAYASDGEQVRRRWPQFFTGG